MRIFIYIAVVAALFMASVSGAGELTTASRMRLESVRRARSLVVRQNLPVRDESSATDRAAFRKIAQSIHAATLSVQIERLGVIIRADSEKK